MHIARAKWPSKNGKVYESIYLRHSYREGGKVQKRNIANLTHCPPEVITAIELALKNKGDLTALRSLKEVGLKEGLSVGAVWTVYKAAERLGIHKALGADFSGKLAFWQVIARVIDQGSRLSAVRVDGCYVITTDVPREVADKEVIHDRYKDLALVEQAFRTCKSAHLEVCPVHVRTEAHTRGHVLVAMLAYLVRRALSEAWNCLDLTVDEGLEQLKTICSMEINVQGKASCLRIPTPRAQSRALLQALDMSLPEALPHTNARVGTRKKLPRRRK